MKSISFIYFDLDDTLLDHRGAEKRALRDLHAHYSEAMALTELGHFQETYHAINSDVWRRYGAGQITKERAKLERFEGVLSTLDLDVSLPADELSTYYLSRYARYWSYLPYARDAFLRIAQAYPVGIMTNGFVEIQNAKLDQFEELRSHSTVILISEEIGFMKPDRRLFEHAATSAGFAPDHILYIGDSYRSDILGGVRAGWQVCWYRPEDVSGVDAATADYTESKEKTAIRSFSRWEELLQWLAI